jgi:hypothetical protein
MMNTSQKQFGFLCDKLERGMAVVDPRRVLGVGTSFHGFVIILLPELLI